MKTQKLAALLILILSVLVAACDVGQATPTPGAGGGTTGDTPGGTAAGLGRPVVVSSKNFTEAEILGELYAVLLESQNITVSKKLNLGTTAVVQEALLRGGAADGIDLYPEYTNTGLSDVLKVEGIVDATQAYEAVKKGYKEKFNLTWLDRSPMNDTQAMVTSKEVSESKGIRSLADLCAKAGEVTVAVVAEFKDRADALPRLQKTYGGCDFKDMKVMEPNLRYQALVNKEVDVAQAFSTDGEIAGRDLVLLEDPKGYGLPYNVAPVVRDEVLQAYPQLASVLNRLSPKITNEEISALNWQVAGTGQAPRDVAKDWLSKQGLLDR